jgi:hypothetical protein
MNDENHRHHHHHDIGITPCMNCGSPLGHDGMGLPCPGKQQDDLIRAIHQSIRATVNREGAIHTCVLVPAATEVLLDLAYKQSMFSLQRSGCELSDVQELLRDYEKNIREGLEDVWRQVLERNRSKTQNDPQ